MKYLKHGMSTALFIKDDLEIAIQNIIKNSNSILECVEIWCDIPHLQIKSMTYAKKINDFLKVLKVSRIEYSLHAPIWDLNLASFNMKIRKESVNSIVKVIEIAGIIGARIVVVHPGYFPYPFLNTAREKGRQIFYHSLDEMLSIADKFGITLALENMPKELWYCCKIRDFYELAERFEKLRFTLDVGHAFIGFEHDSKDRPKEETIADFIREFKGKIVHIHISDNDGKQDLHFPPGHKEGKKMGKINFSPIFNALQDINYKGQIIWELWNPNNPRLFYRKCLAKIRRLS